MYKTILTCIFDATQHIANWADNRLFKLERKAHRLRKHRDSGLAIETLLSPQDIVGSVATLYSSDGPTNDWSRKPGIDNDGTQPTDTAQPISTKKVTSASPHKHTTCYEDTVGPYCECCCCNLDCEE